MISKELKQFNPLTNANINAAIRWYRESIDSIAINGSPTGVDLLHYLKRDTSAPIGPYSNITLFEAANRIMTDLVILYGVKWLLDEHVDIEQFYVEYGHSNKNDFDVMGPNTEQPTVVAEAFNVAPSFFQNKKSRMLKKLRSAENQVGTRYILVNSDAVSSGYAPILMVNERVLLVNAFSGCCSLA